MTAAAEAGPQVSVPRLWPGERVVIVAGGPTAASAPLERLRGACRVIAIKDAIRLVPWADVLYACDAKWWRHHWPTLPLGPRFTLDPAASCWAACLRNTGIVGLEPDPRGLRTGKNSGYQAINLAFHLGAKRVILVGYDMKPDPKGRHHWFGGHPYPTLDPPYAALLEYFHTIAEPLAAAGCEVLNATPDSALDCFPRCSLDQALLC